jgi:hypothetical protein
MKTDSMERAWFPFQLIDGIKILDNKNLIIADTNNKPVNFISSEELVKKKLASEEPWSENFFKEYKSKEFSSYKAYLKHHQRELKYWDSLAVVEHHIANNMDMTVWIQNQTRDTILFPIQDGSLIGIIEALDNKEWKPIQYWWFSWCGNSYEDLALAPNSSIQIGLNNKIGDFKTKMRLKIHGHDTMHFSNEFPGWINKNSFLLSKATKLEILEDKERISFLESVRFGLTVFPDPPEIMIEKN